jgi:glycosyltransferase involved in cell wall biosynthesis
VRLLVLSNLYPPRVRGGYELFCEGVVDHLLDAGHTVDVLTSAGPAAPKQAHVHRALSLYIRGAQTRQPHPLRRLPRERRDHRALERIGEWDVALVFHMVGLAKSLLATLHQRGPVAYVVGDLWPAWDLLTDTWLGRLSPQGPPGTPAGLPGLRYPSYVARGLKPLARWMGIPVQWPDLFHRGHWWANSQWTLDVLLERRHLPLADPRVIRHGIPLDLFPERQPGGGGNRRLLYVGRVSRQKGVDVAIEAMRSLPGCSLTLVGHPDDEFVRGLRLPDRVELRPPVPRAELASIYGEHDLLLFPVTWDEPLGLVPLEAMAIGLPVVATGTGGSSEYLVDEQNCLLVEPGDADTLARAAERLLAEPQLRHRLIAAGRRTAEENSLAASAEQIEAAATDLAGS